MPPGASNCPETTFARTATYAQNAPVVLRVGQTVQLSSE